MLQFIVGSIKVATIVNKENEDVATMPIAPWADKFAVADVLIDYVNETGKYIMPRRSSRC